MMSTGLLDSLLNTQSKTPTPAGQRMQVVMVPRNLIMRNPDNKIYIVGDVQPLVEDIRLNGLRQPLEVVRWANGYKLIGGHRRLTACEQLASEGDKRFDSLPCLVLESHGETDDLIALITANATARELTDGERLAQYEALKKALTQKKKDGQLQGRVRDNLCKILGEGGGTLGRLNVIASCDNDVIKNRLRAGEIGLMEAYRSAQDYARFMGQESVEPEPEEPQKAASAETLPKTMDKYHQHCDYSASHKCENEAGLRHFIKHGEIHGCAGCCRICKKQDICEYRCAYAAPQAAKPEEKSVPAVNPATSENNRGHSTLYKLAQKTLRDDAPWELGWEDVQFQLEYYSQSLPGGAKLWKRIDKTRQDAGQPCEDYAIILQDRSFYTCGWISYHAGIPDILTEFFELK